MGGIHRWLDWYNAYFRVNYTFKAAADGAVVAGDTRSAPINGSFSIFNKLVVKSGGKPNYNVDNIRKHLLEPRSKPSRRWMGRYSFFEESSDNLLPPMQLEFEELI